MDSFFRKTAAGMMLLMPLIKPKGVPVTAIATFQDYQMQLS
jgi:hypothetical protein